MKTKTIITAFLLLFSISSFAQTKEETIEWLNTNGKDFIGGTCDWLSGLGTKVRDKTYVEKITNDTLTWTLQQYEEGLGEGTFYSDISFKSILYQDANTITIKEDKYCPKLSYFIIKTDPYKNWQLEKGKRVESQYTNTDLRIYYYKENEENAKRTLKAIMHLAKLSGAKENKQTF